MAQGLPRTKRDAKQEGSALFSGSELAIIFARSQRGRLSEHKLPGIGPVKSTLWQDTGGPLVDVPVERPGRNHAVSFAVSEDPSLTSESTVVRHGVWLGC